MFLRIALAVSAIGCLAFASRSAVAPPVQQAGPGLALSSVCATCHSNAPSARAMRDAAGRAIAPFDLWRSSMMANAARDPLWRAQVAAEVAATPSRAREIEAKCMRCHAPMAHELGLEDHGEGSLMHAIDCEGDLGSAARDGVSCTICHGITPEGLGTPASYSGEFRLDEERRMFGPHESPRPHPMNMRSGFTPTFAEHVTSSALCGSCHTLFTHAMDADGEESGEVFAEQTPYLEWRNSAFDEERDSPGPHAASCQDCHVPTVDADGKPIRTNLAHNPMGFDFPGIDPRDPYGRHLFVGANTLVLSLLRDNREELGVQAPVAAFDATLAETRKLLRTRTARLELMGLERDGTQLSLRVRVENLSGHKLPTGHPTRRVWLRFVVRDAAGHGVFASGVTDSRGRILGADGLPLASELAGGPIEPHRDVVTSADEVAVFQGVMADTNGQPTFTLMRAARWLRDDRLLPFGWSVDHPDAASTAPVGTDDDPDFRPGSDGVEYRVMVPATGALEVEVELLHQPLAARWAAELFEVDAPEIAALRRMLEQKPRTAELITRTTARVE